MKVLRTVDNMWDSAIARIILREIWERGNFESCCMSMYCELVLRARYIRYGFDRFCPKAYYYTPKRRLFSKFFTPIFHFGSITSYTFPWTRNSQCQKSANSLAENTQNAPQNFSPICLPKPKSFKFLKKSSVWVSIVHFTIYHSAVLSAVSKMNMNKKKTIRHPSLQFCWQKMGLNTCGIIWILKVYNTLT